MSLAIGSLNILGDAYNPVEFLEGGGTDSEFHARYEKIRLAFFSLASSEVQAEASALGFHLNVQLSEEIFSKNCSEAFLERDNKLSLVNRTNLIVCGTMPIGPDKVPLFRRASDWRTLLQAQRDHYLSSGIDEPMILWDIACNLAVEKALDDYMTIAGRSYLNPENLEANAAKLLAPLSSYEEAILAVQEFPGEGSANRAALIEVMNQMKMDYIEKGGMGFIYSKSIHPSKIVQSPLGIEPTAIVDAVRAHLSALGECEALALTEDDLTRLRTTARKTLVMDVSPHLRLVNVHVKEFKTDGGTAFLAQYMRALCDGGGDAAPAHDPARLTLVLSDTNIPAAAAAARFAASAERSGLRVLTPHGAVTTRKKRSELHGQLYDTRKCLRVVEAHKDFALAHGGGEPGGGGGGAWTVAPAGAVSLHPDLGRDPGLLLPNADWASDHCLVRVILSRPPQ